MLAKMTSKNQITLPKRVVAALPKTTYFEVAEDKGRIILTPMKLQKSNAVRDKLAKLGITEKDIGEAVAWARRKK